MKVNRPNFTLLIIVFLTVLCGWLVIDRLKIGIDLGDESYYIALAQRFAHGDQPFRDEMFITQSFSMLTWPIFYLIEKLSGTTQGIILKMRLVFIGFQSIIAMGLFVFLKRTFSVPVAWFSSLSYIFLVPFGLFGLGYSNLGIGLLTLSLICLACVEEVPASTWLLALGGFLGGLSIVAHPGMAAPLGISILVITWKIGRSGSFFPKALIAPLVVLATTALVFFLNGVTWLDYWWAVQAMNYTNQAMGSNQGVIRFLAVVRGIVSLSPFNFLFFTWGLWSLFEYREGKGSFWRKGLWLGSFFILLFFTCRTSQGGLGVLGYCHVIGWVCLLLLAQGSAERRKWILSLWLPCFMGMLTLSNLSNSGLSSGAVAFQPLLPLTLCLLSEPLLSAVSKKNNGWASFLGMSVALLFIFLEFRSLMGTAYRENNYRALTERVEMGAFQGLKTTQAKKKFIEQLQADLARYESVAGRIEFTCFFPAGYLLSPQNAGTPSVWTTPMLGYPRYEALIKKILPELSVKVRVYDETYSKLDIWPQQCEPLKETDLTKPAKLIKREGYELLVAN
ncbi:hypothetical protein EBR03_05915 [bacterium]|nr:hypothetical protein [bacterium]